MSTSSLEVAQVKFRLNTQYVPDFSSRATTYWEKQSRRVRAAIHHFFRLAIRLDGSGQDSLVQICCNRKALDKQLGLSNWSFENAAHEILIGFRTIIGSVLTDVYLFYFEKA